MAGTALDRFKFMLEEHTDGGVTRREFTLRDVMKMINEEPGTVGEFIVSKEVYVNKDKVEVATLPKGAILKSVCIQECQPVPEGCTISFGGGDEANSFGTIEKEKPKPPAPVPTPASAPAPTSAPATTPPKEATVQPKEAPSVEKPKEKGHLHKTFGDGKESDKDQTIYAKVNGLKEGQKPEGYYRVVMVYEKFNVLK